MDPYLLSDPWGDALPKEKKKEEVEKGPDPVLLQLIEFQRSMERNALASLVVACVLFAILLAYVERLHAQVTTLRRLHTYGERDRSGRGGGFEW